MARKASHYPANWLIRVEEYDAYGLAYVYVLTFGDGKELRLTRDEVDAIRAVSFDHQPRALSGADTWRVVKPRTEDP